MWFNESSRYFCKIEKFAYGRINERSFSNPHPWYSKFTDLTVNQIYKPENATTSVAKLETLVELIFSLVCKSDTKEVHDNKFDPLFEKNVRG